MHLRAVFIFVDTSVHDLEVPVLLYLLDERSVYRKITDWSGILVAPGGCCAGKVGVVGRKEEKDPFAEQCQYWNCIGIEDTYALAQSTLL
jgi:hypothetical protein